MNFKTTYILFGLLAALLVLFAVVIYLGPSAPPGGENVFPTMKAKDIALEAKDVQKVVIERKKPAGSDIVIERSGEEGWKITSPRELAGDDNAIDGMIGSLINARVEADVNAPSESSAGLESPSRVVRITGKDRNWTLTLGDVTPGTTSSVIYAASSDQPGRVLVVKKSNLESALEDVNYFRNKKLLGSNTADIQAIKVSEPKKGTVELRKTDGRWTLVQPAFGTADIGDLLTNVSAMAVNHRDEKDSDFVKDEVTKLGEYGLDAKDPVLRIEVAREGKDPAVLLVGKKEGSKYFAAVDNGKPAKDVVRLPESDVKPFLDLLNDPGAKRNKKLAQLDREPDAIDVENPYKMLEFRKPESAPGGKMDSKWLLYRDKTRYDVDDRPGSEMQKLLSELKPQEKDVTFGDPAKRKEYGLDSPVAKVRLYADSLEKPDDKAKDQKPALKKDAKPVAELHFGSLVGDKAAVERIWDKEHTILLVPQTLRDQVLKGPLAYLDRTIPGYNPSGPAEEDVTKVEITRGGETTEIAREDAKGPWKIKKPASLKDRQADDQAVGDILNRLNRMEAREIVAEKADAKEMANYGLANPSTRVVVTLTKDKKPETHEFAFGKEDGTKGVYVKAGNKDMIYRVGPEVVETLKRELRDKTVFSFEPDKVAGLTLTGWAHVAGSPLTRTFEQKDGKWTSKDAGFEIDTTKLADFVNNLSRLRAERFLPGVTALKKDDHTLQVKVTLSDKKVLELTVGAEDAGAYQATSSELKAEVFAVSKSLFEQVRDKPVYFKK